MIKTVIVSFDTIAEADRAARSLRAAGFLENDINIVGNDRPRNFASVTFAIGLAPSHPW